MEYRKCGRSGISLPAVSLGLWHNFGADDSFTEARKMILTAFENGVCHFDLANNYGPPFGSAEITFGKILASDLKGHRNEIFISSKAGHNMWPGVYGNNSSRKNLIASCNDSLRRVGVEYFDVFYSHRYDGETPVEETMQALVDIVKSGKALYAGISKYPPDVQRKAYKYLKDAGVPCLVSQYRCSIFDDKYKEANFEEAVAAGTGIVCFSPLAQGLLTDKYLNGNLPAGSRAARETLLGEGNFQAAQISPQRIDAARQLNLLARNRGQSLAQMALDWILSDNRVTSVIVGASNVNQLLENIDLSNRKAFSPEELALIHTIAHGEGVQFA